MNRLLVKRLTLAFCLFMVSPFVVFAAAPPKNLFDWTKQTENADFTRELSGNLRDNVLYLGTGKITLTPSVKLVKAEGNGTILSLTIKVEAPDQSVQFDDLVGTLAWYQPMEANPRNITIEKSPHTEKFIRQGQLTVTVRNPNAKKPQGMSLERPQPSEPPKYQLFPGQGRENLSPEKILDEEKEAVAYIKKIGGIVSTDQEKAGGHVVEVHFYAANLPNVKGGVWIKKKDLQVIASLKHLRLLDVIHINLANDLLTELAPMKSLDTLELLTITDETLIALNKANQLHTLLFVKNKEGRRPAKSDDVDAIDLSGIGSKISNKGLKELTACKNVTSLTIGGVGLTRIVMPEGLKLIGGFKELKSLKFVGQPFLTDPMIKQFGTLKSLTELKLKANSRDMAKLQKALPDCKVTWE